MYKSLHFFGRIFVVILLGCSPERSDDVIPYQAFGEIVINLSLPEYSLLRTDRGYKSIGGGVKGIILYRENSNTFYAFERNCSYQPNEACSTVEVHISGLYMNDPCCGSTFNFDGTPNGGPAWRPLNRYETSVNGNQLRITDNIIE